MDYYSVELIMYYEKQKDHFKKQAGRNAVAFRL
ncbi:MAG: hypothetical protein JWQ54_5007 [Mucilaginibacter sp.]|nr:hypothetical protein [Mucilaginibacter sp.]